MIENRNNTTPPADMPMVTTDMMSDMMVTPPGDMTPDASDEDMPCVPETEEELCQASNYECGPLMQVMDRCGMMRDIASCGDEATACEENESCGAVNPGECGCVPKTCQGEGVLCGQLFDGCGDMLECNLFCVDNLSSGTSHTCAIGSGRVRCWGKNSDGQLGTGSPGAAKNPAKVPPLHPEGDAVGDAYLISAGGAHTCVVLRNDRAICWGDNEYGQLGNGTNVSSNTVNVDDPQYYVGANNIRQIVSGDRHTCALLDLDPADAFANGFEAHCWGSNDFGIQGRGPSEDDGGLMIQAIQTGPKKVFGLSPNIVQLAAGDLHTCALDNAGDVYCWGNNAFNQLGTRVPVTRSADMDSPSFTYFDNWSDPQIDPFDFRPRKVPGISNVTQIAAGKTFTCALREDETLWCWGTMRFDHARNTCKVFDVDAQRCSEWPEYDTPGTYPVIIQGHSSGNPRFNGMSREPSPTRVLASRATSTPLQMTYARTGDPILAKKIGAGFEHLCFVTGEADTGKFNLSCFGDNGDGQLGMNDNSSRSASDAAELLTLDNNNQIVHALLPTAPDNNDPMAEEIRYRNLLVTPLALGLSHTCVHTVDNNMKCWGDNRDGQIGNEDLMRDNSFRPFIVKLEAEVQ